MIIAQLQSGLADFHSEPGNFIPLWMRALTEKYWLWYNLHFQQSAQHSMHLIQVERLNKDALSKSRPLWLAWMGIEMPALCQLWRLYRRRFGVDHWYRFAKQRLHWTLPKLSTPERCELLNVNYFGFFPSFGDPGRHRKLTIIGSGLLRQDETFAE